MKWHTSGGSVGPCMCAQSWYYFFLVIYMFLTLISSNDRNFRMQLNFSKELHSNSWFFSRASIKDRELDYKLYWAWLFNKTIQQKTILPCFTGFWEVLFNNFSCHPYFTSSAKLDFWQETGETSIRHLIAAYHRLIWAVYEIFWIKNLY